MTSSDTNSSPQEHPMTEATPLASEQITDPKHIYLQPQCCVDPYGEGRQWCEDDGVWEECHEEGCQCKAVRYVREDLAALSASPAPSGALHDHVRKMQEACANYIEPTTYIARHPDTSKIGDCAWVREFPMPDQHDSEYSKAEASHRRDQAFIRDMIYMLDGPEQRAAMSPAPSGQGVSGEVLDMRAERAAGNIPAPAPSCAPEEAEQSAVTAIENTGLLAGDEARDAARAVIAALSPQGLDAKEGGE